MTKAYLAVLAVFAFATLLMVGSPTRSAHAQEPGQLLLEKDCVGVDGDFDFDLDVSVTGGADALAALDAQIDEVNDELDTDLDRDDVLDIIEGNFSQDLTLTCDDDPIDVEFTGTADVGGDIDFDLADVLEGVDLSDDVEVFGLNDLGLGLQAEINEFDDDFDLLGVEVTFSEDCAGGVINLADVLETGVHCTITNTQVTFADLDMELEKTCVNADEGTFGANLAIAVDLSEAPDELLDILIEAGLIDDTLPTELDIDDVLGQITCGETATYTVGEPLRILLAAAIVFDLDFTVTLEEVPVPEGVEVVFGGADCDADGLVLDVSDTGFITQAPIGVASAIEIDSPQDLLLFLATFSSEEAELSCEITNTFPEAENSLTIHKDCVPANLDQSFDISVGGPATDFSDTLGCDDSVTLSDLEAGQYDLRETSASDGLENYTTFIICTDGISAEEVAVLVDVEGATECWIINYDNRLVTPPEEVPDVDEVPVIVIENIIKNVNENNNTNINENENENTQNQNNEQTNTQTTGDTIVEVDTDGHRGYVDDKHRDDKDDKHRSGTGSIRPPNTGSAGLAGSGNGFGLPVAIVAVAALLGTVSLATLKLTKTGGN